MAVETCGRDTGSSPSGGRELAFFDGLGASPGALFLPLTGTGTRVPKASTVEPVLLCFWP